MEWTIMNAMLDVDSAILDRWQGSKISICRKIRRTALSTRTNHDYSFGEGRYPCSRSVLRMYEKISALTWTRLLCWKRQKVWQDIRGRGDVSGERNGTPLRTHRRVPLCSTTHTLPCKNQDMEILYVFLQLDADHFACRMVLLTSSPMDSVPTCRLGC